ncbi:hypothetical protein BC938DRAFT_479795 [Jimgerdemannia flammicorona]|uniref:BTB domain-containing protein n=1 Tax=Jimgerdemannia flammicorona TaxID=994334 RepID=A0A433QK44_9FUNG|nr:hypothetical protein BC938DRAFT_479795 [Jimgerdemannia flammicorona]
MANSRFVHRRLYRRYEPTHGARHQHMNRTRRNPLTVDVVVPDSHGRITRIPPAYVSMSLRRMGPRFYGNPSYANCKLKVGDTEFWGHELFLSWKAQYFRDVFAAVHNDQYHSDVVIEDADGMLTGLPVITLPIEQCRSFDFVEMLYWIYTGDDDRWLSTFNGDNIDVIASNIERLGMTEEARALCRRFTSQ